jgi:hypothetical protein
MKKLTLSLLLFSVAIVGHATHLICGDITYKRIQTFSDSSVQYEVQLVLVRDARQSEVSFDVEVHLGIYDKKSLNVFDSIVIIEPTVYNYNNLLCVSAPTDSFILGVYQATVTLPRNVNGYYITWERCCKGVFENIADAQGTPDQPFYLIADIPNTDIDNSSPDLPYLLQGFCTNTENKWTLALHDHDGDSLAVDLSPLYKGRARPTQNMSQPPVNLQFTPKTEVLFRNGYHHLRPFGTDVNLIIANNEIDFKTPDDGFYNIGLKVKEFRNGELLSEHTIDMAAMIFSCASQGKDRPSGFFLKNFAPMQALLTWNACNMDVSHYEIWRSMNTSVDFKLIDTSSKMTNRFVDSSLSESGRYYYKVKGVGKTGNTSGETDIQFIDMFKLGLENAKGLNDINIYPNPFLHEIRLESNAVIEEVFMFNSLGQQEYHGIPQTQNVRIKTKLKPGLYFITIRSGDGYYTKPLVRLK